MSRIRSVIDDNAVIRGLWSMICSFVYYFYSVVNIVISMNVYMLISRGKNVRYNVRIVMSVRAKN